MTKDEALKRLREIVKGIDKDECASGDGWWETDVGAKYGAERLRLLESLITDMFNDG